MWWQGSCPQTGGREVTGQTGTNAEGHVRLAERVVRQNLTVNAYILRMASMSRLIFLKPLSGSEPSGPSSAVMKLL